MYLHGKTLRSAKNLINSYNQAHIKKTEQIYMTKDKHNYNKICKLRPDNF